MSGGRGGARRSGSPKTGGGSVAIGGSIGSATAGSVLFAGAAGVLAQDNANFYWDDTNDALGIGTGAVSGKSLLSSTVVLAVHPDADKTFVFGRAKLYSAVADYMYLAHYDRADGNSFALRQYTTGATLVNSVSGQSLGLSIGNTTAWRVNGTGLQLEPGNDNLTDLGATTSNRIRRLFMGEYWEGSEMTAPAAPAANKGRVYFEDNGAGKTKLMVIFASGAAQQIAIEP